MHINSHMISEPLKVMYKSYQGTLREEGVDEAEDIITGHAIGATVSALAAGWLPGAGATVATVANIGFIWSMYYRLNTALGISLPKNVLKSIASGIAATISANIISLLVVGTVVSFIPGIGSIAASIIAGACTFSVVLVAAVIYIKMLTKLFKAKADFGYITAEEAKEYARNVSREENVDDMIKEANRIYKQARRDGEFSNGSNVKPMND